jgi:hypothetical protein
MVEAMTAKALWTSPGGKRSIVDLSQENKGEADDLMARGNQLSARL